MSTQNVLKKFEKIYEDTYNTTLKYVICKCYNLDDVNDIMQETYTELYKILKEDNTIRNMQAFVIGIARNKIIKYINNKGKIKTISMFQENEDITVDIDSRN